MLVYPRSAVLSGPREGTYRPRRPIRSPARANVAAGPRCGRTLIPLGMGVSPTPREARTVPARMRPALTEGRSSSARPRSGRRDRRRSADVGGDGSSTHQGIGMRRVHLQVVESTASPPRAFRHRCWDAAPPRKASSTMTLAPARAISTMPSIQAAGVLVHGGRTSITWRRSASPVRPTRDPAARTSAPCRWRSSATGRTRWHRDICNGRGARGRRR